MRMSQTLSIIETDDGRMIVCSKCDHHISPADKSWKMQAVLKELIMNSMGGPFSTGDEVILRSFICPSCGVLLDTEIAMKDDACLEDRIFDQAN